MTLRDALRHDLRTATVAFLAASVVGGPTAVAAAYVANADKVDNKHAVGAGATVNNRKGKLVATNPQTGLLPDNIIAKAPDSDTLDGRDSTAFLAADGTAVDAEKLDGFDSAHLLPRQESASFGVPNGPIDVLTNQAKDFAQVSIAVPGPGRIQVDATTVLFAKPEAGGHVNADLSISTSPDSPNPSPAAESIWAATQGDERWPMYETIPTRGSFQVSAPGTHTYYVVGRGGGPSHYSTQITAQYFPTP